MKLPLPDHIIEKKIYKGTTLNLDNDQELMDKYVSMGVFPTMHGHTFYWAIGRIDGYITGKNIKEAAQFLSNDLRITVPVECLKLISETERRILEQGKSFPQESSND